MDPTMIAGLLSSGGGILDSIAKFLQPKDNSAQRALKAYKLSQKRSQAEYDKLKNWLMDVYQQQLDQSKATRTDAFGNAIVYDPTTKSWKAILDPTIAATIGQGKENALTGERTAAQAAQDYQKLRARYLGGLDKYNEDSIIGDYLKLFKNQRADEQKNVREALGRQAVRMNQSNFLPNINKNIHDTNADIENALIKAKMAGRSDYQNAQGFENKTNQSGMTTFDDIFRQNTGIGNKYASGVTNETNDAMSGLLDALGNTGGVQSAWSGKAGNISAAPASYFQRTTSNPFPFGAVGNDLASLIKAFGSSNTTTIPKNNSRLLPSGVA